MAGCVMAIMAIIMCLAPKSSYTPALMPDKKQVQTAPLSLTNTKQSPNTIIASSVSNNINSEYTKIIQGIKQYNEGRYTTTDERRSYLINALFRYRGKTEVELYIIDLIAMTPDKKNIDALLPYLKSSNAELVRHTIVALANQAVAIDDNLEEEGLTEKQVEDLQATRMKISNGINEIYQFPLTQAVVKEEILANYATTNPLASDLSAMTTHLVGAGKLSDAGVDFMAMALIDTPTAPVAEMLSALKTMDAKQRALVAKAVLSQINLSETQQSDENQQLISDFIKANTVAN